MSVDYDIVKTLRAVADGKDYTCNVNYLCDGAADEIERLTAENERLTRLLDEGQSLVTDACSESFTYAMSRLLGDWVNKVNMELYRQASAPQVRRDDEWK